MYKRVKGDDILSEDPRLKHKWEWSRIASSISKEEIKKWTHFQVSESNFGNWTMSAVQWRGGKYQVTYESVIEYLGNTIDSIGHNDSVEIKTRLEAQIKAETLLIEWITKEYTSILMAVNILKLAHDQGTS